MVQMGYRVRNRSKDVGMSVMCFLKMFQYTNMCFTKTGVYCVCVCARSLSVHVCVVSSRGKYFTAQWRQHGQKTGIHPTLKDVGQRRKGTRIKGSVQIKTSKTVEPRVALMASCKLYTVHVEKIMLNHVGIRSLKWCKKKKKQLASVFAWLHTCSVWAPACLPLYLLLQFQEFGKVATIW